MRRNQDRDEDECREEEVWAAKVAEQEERWLRHAMEVMTRRIERQTYALRRRLESREQKFTSQEWQRFLRRLFPEEQRFVQSYFLPIHERLANAAGVSAAQMRRFMEKSEEASTRKFCRMVRACLNRDGKESVIESIR